MSPVPLNKDDNNKDDNKNSTTTTTTTKKVFTFRWEFHGIFVFFWLVGMLATLIHSMVKAGAVRGGGVAIATFMSWLWPVYWIYWGVKGKNYTVETVPVTAQM